MQVALALVATLSLSTAPVGDAAKPIEILQFEPTVLFPQGTPLKQVARLTMVNNTGPRHRRVRACFAHGPRPARGAARLTGCRQDDV